MEKLLRIGGIAAGIAQADPTLGGRGVLELDDAVQKSVRSHQNPAIGGRIGRLEGQHGKPGAGLCPQALGNDLAGDQGQVAIDDQQGAGKIRQRVLGAGRGMAGAQLLVLDGAFAAQRLGIVAHRIAGGRRHHHNALHPGRPQRADDMAEQRQPGHLVEDLGKCRFHTGALPSGKDHGSLRHGVWVVPCEKKMK